MATGLGALTNVGHDVAATWRSLVEGRSGIGRITAFEQDDSWPVTIAGEVHGFDFDSIAASRGGWTVSA